MRYIKTYEFFTVLKPGETAGKPSLVTNPEHDKTEFNEVKRLCNLYGVKNYKIIENIVDSKVEYSVSADPRRITIKSRQLTSFPFNISEDIDLIDISDNKFESFDGMPSKLLSLCVRNNKFTSMKGCPEVEYDLDISNNPIECLEHCPDGPTTLIASGTNLMTYDFVPSTVRRLYLDGTPLNLLLNNDDNRIDMHLLEGLIDYDPIRIYSENRYELYRTRLNEFRDAYDLPKIDEEGWEKIRKHYDIRR